MFQDDSQLLQQPSIASGDESKSKRARKTKSKATKPVVYTEEELAQMRKREAQRHHAQQLNILTSDNCPKKHPFDFRYGELNEIKRLFPEHKQKAKIKKPGQEVKIVGLDI